MDDEQPVPTRRTIEKLAWLMKWHSTQDEEHTIGELAALYEETPERIMDAIDVLKIMDGEPTQFPPVPW
jgi:hypothetical protein